MTSASDPRTIKVVCFDPGGDSGFGILYRIIMARYLKPYDLTFELTCTSDGQNGLDLINSIQPDIVFLDFMLVGIDGYEVYQRMKADAYMRTIPIIVITVNHGAMTLCMSGKLMVEACFTKPNVTKELGPSVIKILGLADQADA